jgi:hypothetical protein
MEKPPVDTHSLTVYTHVEVREGCEIRFQVAGSNMVWVHFEDNDDREEFEFALDYDALNELIRKGAIAAQEMDARDAAG